MNRQHYSYTHYANKDVAAGFDQLRFSGPIGEYLLETQESLLVEAFKPLAAGGAEGALTGVHVLDVGTGTGRALSSRASVRLKRCRRTWMRLPSWYRRARAARTRR